MSADQVSVLLGIGSESDRSEISTYFRSMGMIVREADTTRELIATLGSFHTEIDVLVLAENLKDGSAVPTVKQAKEMLPDLEILLFPVWNTGSAVEALCAGAFRYFSPQLNLREITDAVIAAAHHKQSDRDKRVRSAIEHVSSAITSTLNLNEIMQRCCQVVVELFGVDHSGLVILNSDLTSGTVVAEYPDHSIATHDGLVGSHIPVAGVEFQERLVNHKEIVNIRELETATALGPVLNTLIKFGIQSILIVPIVCNDKVIGSFGLDSIQGKRTFSPSEIELCKIFADQVAVAIQNANLYDELNKRIEQMDALRETGLAIASTLDRNLLPRVIVERATKLLGAREGGLYEYSLETKKLTVMADYSHPDRVGKTLEPGEGMAGRLVQSDDPYLIVDDYAKWEGRSPHYTHDAFGAVIEVPVIWREHRIGVLYVEDQAGRRFGSQDAAVLRLFADQAAVAIENSTLFREATQRSKKLEALQTIALAVVSTRNLQEIFEKTCMAAVEIFDADHSGLVIFDPSLEFGHVDAEYPTSTGTRGTIIPVAGVPDEEKLVINREPLVVFDVPTDNNLRVVRDILFGRFGIESILIVPVIARGRLLGSFSLDSIGKKRQFTDEEVALCRTFANHVAAAIDNAESYEEARKGRDFLKVLYQSSGAILSQGEPKQILQTFVENICHSTGATRASLVLFLKRGQPSILASHGFERDQAAVTNLRPQGISSTVMKSGLPMFFSNIPAPPNEFHPEMIEHGVKAAACLPLSLKTRTIGVLWIHFDAEHAFSEPEKQALQTYANQAVIAYEAAQTVDALNQTRRRFERRAMLNWVSMLEGALLHSVIQQASAIRILAEVCSEALSQRDMKQIDVRLLSEQIKEIDKIAAMISHIRVQVPEPHELNEKTFRLRNLLDEVGAQRAKTLPSSRRNAIELKLRTHELSDARIRGYPSWLQFAFNALLDNAVNAMPGGGKVVIESKRIGDSVEIRIRDSGGGVPKPIRDMIFKEAISKKPGERGMGIGALLAATVIEEHGGNIELENPGPMRTTVKISLPIVLDEEVFELHRPSN